VTTLAALDLLGADHLWRSQAYASAPIVNGRLVGDLVIVGSEAGLTPAELRRWFKAMRGQGLAQVNGAHRLAQRFSFCTASIRCRPRRVPKKRRPAQHPRRANSCAARSR
jgi:D-alanyl-D-alanine carboxypeptidase